MLIEIMLQYIQIRDKIARSKYVHEDNINKIDEIESELKSAIDALITEEGGVLDA